MKKKIVRLKENHLRELINNSVKRALNEMTQDEYAGLQDDFDKGDDGAEYDRVTKEGFKVFRDLQAKFDPNILKYVAFCITHEYGKYDPFSL